MITIGIGIEIKDLDGNVVMMSSDDKVPFTIGKASALILQNYKGKRFDPIKCLELARTLYHSQQLIIDTSDLIGLKEIIRNDGHFGPLIRGQILEILEKSSVEI